jgi:two-component system response regulator RegA
MTGDFLIVEDEEIVRRALGRLVRCYGDPVFACTAREARALVSAVGAQWRGFVFDIGLPDGNGLELLAEARAAWPDAAAMILTGHLTAAEVNTAHDLRADYVVKPIEGARIVRFLQTAPARVAPRPAHPASVPDTLPECIEHLRALYGAPPGARTRYAIGATIASLKARPDLFGAGAVSAVADALCKDIPSLYRHAAVAERLSLTEVEALLARRGPGGQSLSWSHLVVLGSVGSAERRERLVADALAQGLSVRALAAAAARE